MCLLKTYEYNSQWHFPFLRMQNQCANVTYSPKIHLVQFINARKKYCRTFLRINAEPIWSQNLLWRKGDTTCKFYSQWKGQGSTRQTCCDCFLNSTVSWFFLILISLKIPFLIFIYPHSLSFWPTLWKGCVPLFENAPTSCSLSCIAQGPSAFSDCSGRCLPR